MDVSSVNESHLVFAIDVSAEFTPSFLAGRCAAHPTTVSDQVLQSQETTPSIRPSEHSDAGLGHVIVLQLLVGFEMISLGQIRLRQDLFF